MIDFKPITELGRNLYNSYLFAETERGCELSYANLGMWGEQKAAVVENQLIVFSKYNGTYMYHFPMGTGDKKPALDCILKDAKERGILCSIFSLNQDDASLLERLYPNTFEINFMRDSFDYVYSIEKLAGLKGRKYHRKRNHYNHFCKKYPEFYVEALSEKNLPQVKVFIDQWYQDRLAESPENDYGKEQLALEKCLREYKSLGLESLVLFGPAEPSAELCTDSQDNEEKPNERLFAFTIGSRISPNTFDVHFEKARWDVEGAYTAINCEFAKFIQEKYPEIEFLNREEDMGLPGLRKAKESYFPHHMVEKAVAVLKEDFDA